MKRAVGILFLLMTVSIISCNKNTGSTEDSSSSTDTSSSGINLDPTDVRNCPGISGIEQIICLADAPAILTKYTGETNDTYISWSGSTGLTTRNDYLRIDGPSVWIDTPARAALLCRVHIRIRYGETNQPTTEASNSYA